MSDIVPIRPEYPPYTVDQKETLDAFYMAAQEAKITGFGADGSITATIERVRSNRLWCLFPDNFTDDDKDSVRGALIANQNKQLNAIRVIKVPNPQDKTADLLIVDYDGQALWMATQLNHYEVIVEKYDKAFYQYIIRMVNQKFQQSKMRHVDIGRFYLEARRMHEIEQVEMHKKGVDIGAFLTQDEVAFQFGISARELKYCISAAKSPDMVIDLLEEGRIGDNQLREIATIANSEERSIIAQEIADKNTSIGEQVSRKEVRDHIDTHRSGGSGFHFSKDVTIRADNLWTHHVKRNIAAPVALGYLLHDIGDILPMLENKQNPLVKQLIKIINHPDVQQFIKDIEPAS